MLALTEDGVQSDTAANGREALTCIATHRPTLVLLDLRMPVMTGWEVLVQLQHLQARIPVVFMSAERRLREEAERHGADGYLAKPFSIDELLRLVHRLTHH